MQTPSKRTLLMPVQNYSREKASLSKPFKDIYKYSGDYSIYMYFAVQY